MSIKIIFLYFFLVCPSQELKVIMIVPNKTSDLITFFIFLYFNLTLVYCQHSFSHSKLSLLYVKKLEPPASQPQKLESECDKASAIHRWVLIFFTLIRLKIISAYRHKRVDKTLVFVYILGV